jgi:hypothetical protein
VFNLALLVGSSYLEHVSDCAINKKNEAKTYFVKGFNNSS